MIAVLKEKIKKLEIKILTKGWFKKELDEKNFIDSYRAIIAGGYFVVFGIAQGNKMNYQMKFWLIGIITILLFVLIYFRGKQQKYMICKKIFFDTKELEQVENRYAFQRAFLIFINGLWVFYIIESDYTIPGSFGIQLRDVLRWITPYYLLVFGFYVVAIWRNSALVKLLGLIFVSYFSAIIGIVYLTQNIEFFLTHKIEKYMLLALYGINHLIPKEYIIGFIIYTIGIIFIFVMLTPKSHFCKIRMALQIMNALVVLVTFMTFLYAEDVINKKDIIMEDFTEEVYIPMTKEKETFISGINNNPNSTTDELEKAERYGNDLDYVKEEMRKADEYFDEVSTSNVRDLAYLMLFPYVLLIMFATLILNLRDNRHKSIAKVERKECYSLFNIDENILKKLKNTQKSE